MENTIIDMPKVRDLDEFNRLHGEEVNSREIPEVDKRYLMFIEKKKSLALPLTYDEQKIINIIA